MGPWHHHAAFPGWKGTPRPSGRSGSCQELRTVTTAKGPSLSDSAEGCSLVGLTLPTEEEQRVSCSRSSSAEVIVCSR